MPQPNLKSQNPLDIAYALTDMQFAAIKKTGGAGSKAVAEKLQKLRGVVWSEKTINEEIKTHAFTEALEGLDKDQIKMLCESYARMGELYETSCLTARDNQYIASKNPIPGGVTEFVNQNSGIGVQDVLAKLSVPVFEMTMTMHPTNVKGLPAMQAARNVALAIRNVDNDKAYPNLKDAIERYQNTPILHEVNGKPANLMVRDETKTVLNYLGNIYDDLPGIFKHYDKPLENKFKAQYKPLDLKLNARFASWGSGGDKDGNDNVTAEKTLEAIALHTQEIVGRYRKDLKGIDNPAHINAWKDKLDHAQEKLTPLLVEMQKLTQETDAMRPASGIKTEGDSKASNARFDKLSQDLATIRKELDAKKFEEDLTKWHDSVSGADKEKALEMVRKVRWFGFNFSKIEYRETAEEYQKVVGEILKGHIVGDYNKLTPKARAEVLERLLTDGIPPAILMNADKIRKSGAKTHLAVARKAEDATPIAYQSLKRMELARDHNGMIQDNVLAECGTISEGKPTKEDIRYQGVANMLEAQLLQRLVETDNKKGPFMGVIPLFEDPSTMENIEGIMGAVYDSAPYKKHLKALAEIRNDGVETQQVQIAHSDNRRRAGLLGGTALIHEAHQKVRKVNADHKIRLQFYEGGSISDPFRNGARAISAHVNAFNLHDFAKFTFQGRDMYNYFNHPGSNERMFTRHFVHPASRVQMTEAGKWEVNYNAKNGDALVVEGKPDRRPNAIIEEVAIAALKKTLNDYRDDDFKDDAMGTLYAMLGEGYVREAAAGNRGSRAASRSGAMAKVDSTHVGKVWNVNLINNVRTIPFSMMPQQNKLLASFVGGQNLNKYLCQEVKKRLDNIGNSTASPSEIDEFKKVFADLAEDYKHKEVFTDKDGKSKIRNEKIDVYPVELLPKHAHYVYEKSSTFRDAMDKAAFAIARTDMVDIQADVKEKFANNLNDDAATRMIKAHGRKYMDKLAGSFKSVKTQDGRKSMERLEGTYEKVGNLVYAALLGTSRMLADNQPKPFLRHVDINDTAKTNTSKIQADAIQMLNGLGEDIALKNNYLDFLVHTKATLGKKGAPGTPEDALGPDDSLLAIILAGGLSSTHSRWLKSDDPATYREQGPVPARS